MAKFVSGYHKVLQQLMLEVHKASSKAEKNRYRIGQNTLVYWQSGRVCELFIGDQGVRYFDPKTMQATLEVIPKQNWPMFSVVDVSALFKRRLTQLLQLPQFDKDVDFAQQILAFPFKQIIDGDVNASDVHSDL